MEGVFVLGIVKKKRKIIIKREKKVSEGDEGK